MMALRNDLECIIFVGSGDYNDVEVIKIKNCVIREKCVTLVKIY